MRRVQINAVVIASALALSACGGGGPVADEAENVTALPSVDNIAGGRDGVPSADGGAPPNAGQGPPAAAPIDAKPAGAIPAALHGRWGMTPGDCTSTAGDTKGLLIISRDNMRFYESEAIPIANVETSADSFSADFAFSGEGQNWKKFQTLVLDDDRLVRTESSPMASFTYARCR
jgi:hypothetical protein